MHLTTATVIFNAYSCQLGWCKASMSTHNTQTTAWN